MAEVCTATAPTEQIHKSLSSKEFTSDGVLKGENGKEYAVFVYKETEGTSKGVSEFLAEMSASEMPGSCTFEAVWITPSEIRLFVDIKQMECELEQVYQPKNEAEASQEKPNTSPLMKSESSGRTRSQEQTSNTRSSNPVVSASRPQYASVFSLARAMSPFKPRVESGQKEEHRTESREQRSFSSSGAPLPKESASLQTDRQERRDKEKDQGGKKDQEQAKDQEKERERREVPIEMDKKELKNKTTKKTFVNEVEGIHAGVGVKKERPKLSTPHANTSVSSAQASRKTEESLGGVDDIFIRFMALMARILGQAEASAHELYQKIKHRTDDIDTLTHFMSKINSSKGKIDWTKDEEMKQLLEKVRELGVDIPAGKYTWSEEEKKLLKENIQMRKDSMEKITQLERTDMQRYLQEASQCHQARSNVLKLLKEVMDTIIHNFRPS